MRIVQYLDRIRLEDGGVVRAVLDVCTLLAQHGHDVSLIAVDTTDVPGFWPRAESAGDREGDRLPLLETIPPKGATGFYPKSVLARVEAILEGADILHNHTMWDRGNLQFGKIARRLGIPYVATTHGMLDDWCMAQSPIKKRIYHRLFLREYMRHATFVQCTAEFEKSQAQKWFPPEKGVVIPYAFDTEPYRDLPPRSRAEELYASIPRDTPVVLFLSRLHHKKGVDVFIEAAARLRESGRAFKAVIVGGGEAAYEAELREQVRRLKLDEHLVFLGMVLGDKEKIAIYRRADVFVLPTSQENFGFVLVEALACGTPVVTTRGADIWTELQESGGALVVDREAGAIAAATGELLDDAARRDSMGRTGREWVLEQFDATRLVQMFESLYARAVESVKGISR